MAGEQFCEKYCVRVSFSVTVRVSDSVSASVSFAVNMFEIAGPEVPLALCLHNTIMGCTQA